MIDYDTILSTTEDKMTLLQWLKKVEAALKDASATSFKVNKKGDATLTFSIEFADGTELESGEIVLQQGESVQSAAIVNGHLILTLTNGDELDAGDLGGVTSFSIDASQHLIVHYQNGTTQDLGAIFSGDISINGDLSVSGHIYGVKIEDIKDAQGHPRFIEGDIVSNVEGITLTFGKWSLSGSHLMFVASGSVANETALTGKTICQTIDLPTWIYNKIYPNIGGSEIICYGKFDLYGSDFSSQSVTLRFDKANNRLGVFVAQSVVLTADRTFRIAFDLLIDNE